MEHTEAEIDSVIARQNVAKEGFTTFYVDQVTGNDAANFLRWETAAKTIQAAIDKAESWCKIYVKAGTYAENVTNTKGGVHIIGESASSTIISPSSGIGIYNTGQNFSLSNFTLISNVAAVFACHNIGDFFSFDNIILDTSINHGRGIKIESSSWGSVRNVKSVSNKLKMGIWCTGVSLFTTISNCYFDLTFSAVVWAIIIQDGSFYEVYGNTFKNCIGSGTFCQQSFDVCEHNTIYHNNFINCVPAANPGALNNSFFENYYDNHIIDTNNDGLCDSPYTFTGGIDYHPVSKRNGWEQISLGGGAGGGSEYQGDIEIFDSFEYPTDAALQAKWIEGGDAGNPTRSLTVYEGQYSLQTIIGAGGVGHVYRLLAARNMKTLANIGIASQSSVDGDTFQFTLYDSSGNYSYWTETCYVGAGNTWKYHNINPHSVPTGVGPAVTGVDLEDVVEIRMANLTASSTYKFDFIKFSSLVASKIGIGYDGLDDAVENSSSVRGHLLLTDELLSRTGTFYFVGIGGNDANDGKSWTNRRLTVASGYGLCSSGDTLIIGPGTFTEDINFNTDGVWVIGRGQGLDGTTIDGASTMTCGSNRFENIFFLDATGTVVKVGNDADAQYNEFRNCRIGGGGVAIPVHIDGTAGGKYNIFDHCNIYEGSTAAVLIDGGAATGNIFRECRMRPQTAVASHGIHVNHASTLRNTFIDCVIVGAGSTGTGIYFQLGTHNIAFNCLVNDITTPYNIAANNYIVGCHEGSLIATNNTIQDDLKNNYDKIRGTPASGVIANLNVNTEVDLIAEVTQTTVAEIDAFYVDYTGWLGDANITGFAPTLTIRVYLDDDGGTLREVGNLRDVITESISVGSIVKIDSLGTFERNFKVTVQSSIAPAGGAASDLVKYHYVKYDRE